QAPGRDLLVPTEVDPVGAPLPELRPGPDHRPAVPAVLLEHDPGDAAGGRRRCRLVLAGRLRLRPPALPRARRLVYHSSEHADVADPRDDDPALPPVPRLPVAGHVVSPLGAGLPRDRRLLHLPAAPVLPRHPAPARPLGAHGWLQHL